MEHFGLTAFDLSLLNGYEVHCRSRVLKVGQNPELQAGLMWAAHRGSLVQLQEALAGGADSNFRFETQTMLGMVLHWRTEEDGATEMFRELVRAGADPTRTSENKSLMWIACQHGNKAWAVEILLDVIPNGKFSPDDLTTALVTSAGNALLVKRLLNSGARVNRRAVISNALIPGIPVSALMTASFWGNPDSVQLLLAAGADVNLQDDEGHTALDYAMFDRKRCRKVIPLLEKAGGVASNRFPRHPDEAARGFAAAAKKPAFKEAVANIKGLTGVKPERLMGAEGIIPGGYGFLFKVDAGEALVEGRSAEFVSHDDRVHKFVDEHHSRMLAKGFYLFHSRDLLSRNGPVVALLPTADVYRVLAALETNGANGTENLITWLRELEKDQPFSITGVGFDFLEGRFTIPIKDPAALVRRINAICPEGIEGSKDEIRQVEHLRQTNRLYLWWD